MRSLRGLALFAVLTVLLTWPLAANLTVMDAGDSAFFAWEIGWELHALKTDPSQLPHANIFHPLRYTYSENPDRLPLYVLVDRHTWSAAEYFAALLQDNRAAVVVGELTGGAGCGYTNDGIPTLLPNSGAKVRMPDCVRLRKDGSNEVAGVTPDVLVPWANWESPFTKADKMLRYLRRSSDFNNPR